MSVSESRHIHPDEHWEAAAAEIADTPLPEGETRGAVDPIALQAIKEAPAAHRPGTQGTGAARERNSPDAHPRPAS